MHCYDAGIEIATMLFYKLRSHNSFNIEVLEAQTWSVSYFLQGFLLTG